jgi:ketosteroid isomerase-like protein
MPTDTEPVEVIEIAVSIVVAFHFQARARSSGEALDMHEVHAVAMRAGTLVEIREYRTTEEALGSLGQAA